MNETSPYYCTDCNSTARLERRQNGTPVVTCFCKHVADDLDDLPDAWSAGDGI